MAITYENQKARYTDLWSKVSVRNDKISTLDWYINKLLDGKNEYQKIEQTLGIPWFVVGVIHAMEGSFSFKTHLHNGDPLNARTVNVPENRPVAGNPPFSWRESAIDALEHMGASSYKHFDSIEGICFYMENYNGWGYYTYHNHVNSAYLWSFTNHYTKGKYVSDGKWDENAVSGQAGSIAILKRMVDRGMIDFKEDYQEEKKPTWFRFYNGEGDHPVLVGFAGSEPVIKYEISNNKIENMIEVMQDYLATAKNFAVANGHKIPEIKEPEPEDPVDPEVGFDPEKAVAIALAEAKQDISWRGNGKAKKYTKKYEPVFGTGRFSWCAAFVTWVVEQTGVTVPVKPEGGDYTFALCEQWQQWAISKGYWHDGVSGIQKGDIVLFDWEGATFPDSDWEDHIGIFAYHDNDSLICYEGNVSDATAIKRRYYNTIQGYIRIPKGTVHLDKKVGNTPQPPPPMPEYPDPTKDLDGTYTWDRGQDFALSEHFRASEFTCKCGSCRKQKISKRLVAVLEYIRTTLGKPVHITSGYRCPLHNTNVGGVSNSQHVKGTAADTVVSGFSPSTVSNHARIGLQKYNNSNGGIGTYSSFTHIDVRNYPAIWNG